MSKYIIESLIQHLI